MSVKTMTTEQLQNDLKGVAQMWPGGIPMEQNDRVNALKSELKRRAAPIDVSEMLPTEKILGGDAASMSDDQLATELRKLSNRLAGNPKDEEAQMRFADIRFEIRRRAKSGTVETATKIVNEETAQRAPVPHDQLDAAAGMGKLREQRNHALLVVDQMMQVHNQFMEAVNDALQEHKNELGQLAAKLMGTP